MLNLETMPKNLLSATCCFCMPIKVGLFIMAIVFIIEELLSIPEYIEFESTWYKVCLGLSLIPGFLSIFYYTMWMNDDNVENRKKLVLLYQIKWL